MAQHKHIKMLIIVINYFHFAGVKIQAQSLTGLIKQAFIHPK